MGGKAGAGLEQTGGASCSVCAKAGTLATSTSKVTTAALARLACPGEQPGSPGVQRAIPAMSAPDRSLELAREELRTSLSEAPIGIGVRDDEDHLPGPAGRSM